MEDNKLMTRPVRVGSRYYDYCVERYDNIKRVLREIEMNKVIVLTGENGSGKSLVRKLMWSVLEKQAGCEVKITDTSMYRFTDKRGDMKDSSSRNLIQFINHWKDWENRYIVIDMPELGLSESYLLGMIEYLNTVIPAFMKLNYGVMVITHSKTVVRNIRHDVFLNMENVSESEWLDRVPEPVYITELIKRNGCLKKFMCTKLSEPVPEEDNESDADVYISGDGVSVTV